MRNSRGSLLGFQLVCSAFVSRVGRGREGGVGCSGTGSSKSRAAINATHARSGSMSLVQLFSPSYTNIPAAEEQLVDQLA